MLDTLAAAQAEVGDFAGALRTMRRALALDPDRPETLSALQERGRLYRQGLAYRDPGFAPPGGATTAAPRP